MGDHHLRGDKFAHRVRHPRQPQSHCLVDRRFPVPADESVLRPTRNFLPYLGGIDISPWIAVILIQVIQGIVLPRIYGAIEYGAWQQLVF